MQKSEVVNRAIAFFTSKGYHVQSQSDMLLIFLSDKRDVNWLIVLVLCCLGIIPAAIYYFFFCPQYQVTLSITGDIDAKVIATGTTPGATEHAEEFMKLNF